MSANFNLIQDLRSLDSAADKISPETRDLVERAASCIAALDDAVESLANDRRLFVPGQWECPKCQFMLSVTSINVASGNIGTTAADREEPRFCPNDHTPMVRESWEARARFLMRTDGIRMAWVVQDHERLEAENKKLRDDRAESLLVKALLAVREVCKNEPAMQRHHDLASTVQHALHFAGVE